MPALAKLSLLFASGLTVGLVVPWGFGPAKPAAPAADRSIVVRCIVECRNSSAERAGIAGRVLPRPDQAPRPGACPATGPVEIVVHPATENHPASSGEVTVILRLIADCCNAECAAPPPVDRPMPGAM